MDMSHYLNSYSNLTKLTFEYLEDSGCEYNRNNYERNSLFDQSALPSWPIVISINVSAKFPICLNYIFVEQTLWTILDCIAAFTILPMQLIISKLETSYIHASNTPTTTQQLFKLIH